jgi:hypothetical protein
MRMGKINETTLALGEGSPFECIYVGGSTRGAAQRAAQSNISSKDKRAYTTPYLTMFCVLTQEYYKATKESCLEGHLRKARDKVFLECAHVPELRADVAGLCNTADFRDAPVFVGALGDGNWTKELYTIDSEKAKNMLAIKNEETLSYIRLMGGGILNLGKTGFSVIPICPCHKNIGHSSVHGRGDLRNLKTRMRSVGPRKRSVTKRTEGRMNRA